MSSNASGSKRWQHFYAALHLAIQRSAHKWTWEDFTECFPLFCQEQPESAAGVFNTVSKHMESNISDETNKFFDDISMKQNIDDLHAVVAEARVRKKTGEVRTDVWKEDLHPRAATRARTIPVLEETRDRLLLELEQLEADNKLLQETMRLHVEASRKADDETQSLLDVLEEALRKWDELPSDEMQGWTRDMASQRRVDDPNTFF